MNDDERLRQIKIYRAALDCVLLTGSPQQLINFMRRHGVQEPSSLDAAEVTMHKTITASQTLPLDVRRRSKAWLDAHGYHGLDDGDL